MLEAGDRVPADATAVFANRTLVDASLLTGESNPVRVVDGEFLFAGTFVVEGEADALVTAAGASTRLAEIARLTTLTAKPASPLTIELHHVVRTIAVIAFAVGGTGLMLLIGNDVTDGFVFAIGVTVGLVPEALLPTVTLSLAIGSRTDGKTQRARAPPRAVETLGSTTFICTDKTGTLDPQSDGGRRRVDTGGVGTVDGARLRASATIGVVLSTGSHAGLGVCAPREACRWFAEYDVSSPKGTANRTGIRWRPRLDVCAAAPSVSTWNEIARDVVARVGSRSTRGQVDDGGHRRGGPRQGRA